MTIKLSLDTSLSLIGITCINCPVMVNIPMIRSVSSIILETGLHGIGYLEVLVLAYIFVNKSRVSSYEFQLFSSSINLTGFPNSILEG